VTLLDLDPEVTAGAGVGGAAAEPVIELARAHTTVAVERATLRLAGSPARTPRIVRVMCRG